MAGGIVGGSMFLADFVYLITIRDVLAKLLLEILASIAPRGRCPRLMLAEECSSYVSSRWPIMSNICT